MYLKAVPLGEWSPTYLHISILPSENGDSRQTSHDAAFQDENRGPHQPVQGHDTGRVVLAGFATLRAG